MKNCYSGIISRLILIIMCLVAFQQSMMFPEETGSSAKFYLDAGINLYNQEKYFDAIDSFRNALEINPFYGDAYKYMAEVYFVLGEYQVSLENSLNALKYANNDPDAMLIVANSYRELEQYDQSVRYYNAIISKFPSYVEVYRNLAELYMKMNKLPLALSTLNKADRINKNYWKNYISFGNYYLKNNDLAKAEEYFRKAFIINPSERIVYVTLADFYRSVENYDEAIALLESGEKLFDNFYSGILLMADCYLSKAVISGRGYDKAIEKYNWIKENNLQKDIHFKSRLYYKIGFAYETIDVNKAVENYRAALKIDPGNEFIRNAFEYFVMNCFKVDSPVRKELALYHLNASGENYKKGENKTYFFHLKRSITIYPLLIEPRRKLVSYFESRKDTFNAYQELKSMSKIDSSVKVKDKIENHEWMLRNNKIKLESQNYYNYKGLFLVQASYLNFPKVYADILLYSSQYYNKFKLSTMDYRKEQGINAVLEYLRANNYSFFVIGSLDKSLSYIQFSLYDKNGKLIEALTESYKMEGMNTSVNRFLEWMDNVFPSIWTIGDESSPDVYYLSAGLLSGMKNSETFVAFELSQNELKPLSFLKIKNLENYYSFISVVSNYKERNYESLKDKFVIKNEYFSPKYLTNLKRILGY